MDEYIDKYSKEELLSSNILKVGLDEVIKLIKSVQDNYIKLADSDVKEENILLCKAYSKILEESIKQIGGVNFYLGLLSDNLSADIDKKNTELVDSYVNNIINNK